MRLSSLLLPLALTLAACGDKDTGDEGTDGAPGDGGTVDTDTDGGDTDTDTDTDGGDTDTDGGDTDTDVDTDTDGGETDTDVDTDTDGGDTDGDTDTDGGDTDTDTDTDGGGDEDADDDGYDADIDCDDSDPDVNPGADEVCDGIDNDCDDRIDDDDVGVVGTTTFYTDDDGDGWGDDSTRREACERGPDEVEDGGDCDDDDEEAYPGADEICDGVDNDCDGDTDDDDSDLVGGTTYYRDSDRDGYGDDDTTMLACEASAAWATSGGDCDDDDPAVNPGEDEVCDADGAVDEDCDGDIDDDDTSVTGTTTWYRDDDRDGFGDDDRTTVACDLGTGWADVGGDCDDDDDGIHPDADEVCDDGTVDEDCDGDIDDDDDSVTGTSTWYVDSDGDGVGVDDETVEACDPGAGWSLEDGDCDDGDEDVSSFRTWYRDLDGDGYGDDDVTDSGCEAPTDYVAVGGDCNDLSSAKNPGATEVCDDEDNDCDELVDDEDSDLYAEETGSEYYWDDDEDGYGDPDESVWACELPSGYVTNDEDCDDADDAINPDATEICDDGIDQDCDELPGDCGIASGDYDDLYDHAITGGTGYYSGYILDINGDYDGDGEPDLLYGNDHGTDTSDGHIYAINGPVTDHSSWSSAPVNIEPGSDYDGFGTDAAWAGDVDRDGYDDLVVGSPDENGSISTGYHTNLGYARVFSGRTLRFADDDGDAMIELSGSASNQYCGSAVAGGEDLDGDGEEDFVVSCAGPQRVALYFSEPASGLAASRADTIVRVEAYDIALGDVDGDGVADLLPGNWDDDTEATDGGALYLFMGPFTADVDLEEDDAEGVRYGADRAYLGRTVTVVGDTDGDGYGDIAFADWNEDAVGIIAGGVSPDLDGTPATWLDGGSSYAGVWDIAGGDLNGDDLADVVLGIPSYSSRRGAVVIAYAPFDATEDLRDTTTVLGAGTVDYLGTQVVTHDVDEDGLDDVIASCPGCVGAYVFYSGWY